MKIQDLEKISEYFDEEAIKPQEIIELLNSDTNCKKLYSNFKVISEFIKKDSQQFLNNHQTQIENCWPKLEQQFEREEQKLNELLQSAFILPFEEIDLWGSIEQKLDLPVETAQVKDKKNAVNYALGAQDWELLLNESFKLPTQLSEADIWPKVHTQLDSIYHEELFSENLANESLSSKEKFLLGLSEYFDGEVSANKAQIVNEHLIECSSCRGYYLNLVKLKNTLKQSFMLPKNFNLAEDDFWFNLEQNLFSENTPQKKLV